MKKTFNLLRVLSLGITIISAIALVIIKAASIDIDNEILKHAHVAFGFLFVLIAIPSMIIEKKANKDKQ